MQFIVVEYPDDASPMPDFTRDNPGSTIDIIAEPATPLPDGDLMHPCIAQVRGAPWPATLKLVAVLQQAYESVNVLVSDPRVGQWIGRMRIRETTFRHTATFKVMQYQRRFGGPWVHLEAGVIHLRARVPDAAEGEALAAAMRKGLAEVGVPAQVELRELGAKDYGVWQDLIQRSIGLV